MEYSNLPDIGALAALRAVVERGGVTEAARALHVGQPAVTKRLRTLEHTYGVSLVQRAGGRLRLTAAGEKVYALAVHTLDRAMTVREELQQRKQGRTSMRLVVSHTIGEHFLSELLLQFAEAHAGYRVHSRVAYSRQIQADLAHDAADLALLEAAPDHPDVVVQKWFDDEIWLVCGHKHPLAGTDLIDVEQLGTPAFVLRESRSSVREATDEALRRIGIENLNVKLEVGATDAILDILERGRHMSFLPRFAVLDRVEAGVLARIKVKGFRLMRTLWIARHRTHLDHPVAEAFVKMLRDAERSAA